MNWLLMNVFLKILPQSEWTISNYSLKCAYTTLLVGNFDVNIIHCLRSSIRNRTFYDVTITNCIVLWFVSIRKVWDHAAALFRSKFSLYLNCSCQKRNRWLCSDILVLFLIVSRLSVSCRRECFICLSVLSTAKLNAQPGAQNSKWTTCIQAVNSGCLSLSQLISLIDDNSRTNACWRCLNKIQCRSIICVCFCVVHLSFVFCMGKIHLWLFLIWKLNTSCKI